METASSPTVLPNSTQQRSAKYTITLQGSQWDVAYYGIVEFLRAHPSGRIIVGIVGALSLVLLAASLLVTIPGLPKGAWFWLLFITPAVLWTATVSGPLFELTFPAAKASAEREFAEKQFDRSRRRKQYGLSSARLVLLTLSGIGPNGQPAHRAPPREPRWWRLRARRLSPLRCARPSHAAPRRARPSRRVAGR